MVRNDSAWSLASIPYESIDRSRIADSREWFGLLAASSFIEILSDLYTRSLIAFFSGDDEVCGWLGAQWEREELQHGRALRRYVFHVWPEFDWERGFAGFKADYTPYCQTALLGPTRTLEMAARCVVETGTSSFYTMVRDVSPEPVLANLAERIRADEVGHFKQFYRFYRAYQRSDRHSRWRIGRELWRRVVEVDSEDAYLGVKNAFLVRYPTHGFVRADFEAFRARVAVWMRQAYPFPMAAKMLLKPLELPVFMHRMAVPTLIHTARHAVSRVR